MPLVRQFPLRFSVHVDAGYLYASLATLITGSSNRAAVIVDEPALIKGLISIARADTPRLCCGCSGRTLAATACPMDGNGRSE